MCCGYDGNELSVSVAVGAIVPVFGTLFRVAAREDMACRLYGFTNMCVKQDASDCGIDTCRRGYLAPYIIDRIDLAPRILVRR